MGAELSRRKAVSVPDKLAAMAVTHFFRLAKSTIEVPLLFIQAEKDTALPSSMSTNMENYCSRLTRQSVAADHWALWEAAEQVNGHIRTWLERTEKETSLL